MTTIKEIRELLATVKDLDNPLFLELEKDSRTGVQKEISKRKKAIQAELDEDLRLESMLSYEKELYKQGLSLIAGVDEVGRGPLAGPVVAAAVILPKNCKIRGLNDSKKTPKKKHWEIFQAVQDISNKLAEHGTFNFILSNGEWMIARCSTNLHYLTRKAPFGKAQRVDDDGVIDFNEYAKEGDKVTIITTVPLTKDEVWRKMENGGFVFFKNGEKVWEIIGTPRTEMIDDGTLGTAKVA